ncbi:hydroxycarboxylic acid receptor 2-like isoform X1 [Thunnus albacares]|uniref:hydroxycarboxylic acid receptor 2-like isoform X1 n=1 Tax=Thunnus albacares TaxID=8236 RepID=UPI001CF6444E|nr:hydroxycarboxylic acid receptor 2-like isoform X1 [Thunnus albacares]XP_044194087.1 hydroxycarboxylic acid receptor 2-like isoform X1 [Thunnus albacares]XP_044194088.1 hydroxycarboxylic acid receptor 2-like isoform X1 [Thunnus albacares]XP_044194089.1 hydroxycarboxylic acid receptor 2-like isoform X1 [Thunnus albacares]XP_044194090.1 hydroxycarboxylic acid receptor 2-like isoform X1 [Thunnus albacares]
MISEYNKNLTMTMLNFTTPIPGDGGSGVSCCQSVHSQLEGAILPPVLTINVILGLLGNIVALWIFCFKLKVWNPNNLFLFNLVIADFLALMSLPLRIDAALRGHWVFGDGLCRIDLFLMFSNRSASIALMTVVAIYRYFKVVHPHHRFNHLTKRQAVHVLVFVWLLVISLWAPILAYKHIKGSGNSTQCLYFTSSSLTILVKMHRMLTVLEFIIPLAMLLFCSIRISSFLRERQMGKADKVRKAMRVCNAIVAMFTVCFLPTTVMTIGVWVIRSFHPRDCATLYTFIKLTIVSLWLNFLNSALDPILYIFSSSMFKKALCSSLPHFLHCGQDAGNAETTACSTESQSVIQMELKSTRADRGNEAML